jgi:hypothetical protein
VVDGKVINRELAWRDAEGGTGILLRIRTEVYVGCLSSSKLTQGKLHVY